MVAHTLKSRLDEKFILIVSVLIVALCSLVYELLISTVTSYFLGDSIKQFSITIGLYMASMGIGSYLSRLMHKHLLAKFITVEILLGLIGGLAVPLLYAAFAFTDVFYLVFLALILVIGTLTGLEIPLLTRIMERHYALKTNISNVLSLDYFGALLATLAFPFILLPFLGTFKSSLIFGLINMGVGFLNLWYFADTLHLDRKRVYYLSAGVVTVFLGTLLIFSQIILDGWNSVVYEDRVVYSKQTPYQKLVMTRYKDDVRLYINGSLQFSSIDEHRYHETLIHIPFAVVDSRRHVLVLGGGDGLAAREMLKYDDVANITIVDLDPAVFNLARKNANLFRLNKGSLNDPRVTTVANDAFVYLQDTPRQFDIIVADLPDPNNVSLARLYSREFYKMVSRALKPDGVFVTQSTSPYYARQAFWCIHRSVEAGGLSHVYPYHTHVPSFGEWGFIMARKRPLDRDNFYGLSIRVPTQYLTEAVIAGMFQFPKDIGRIQTVQTSTLDQPKVLEYYLQGWQYWN